MLLSSYHSLVVFISVIFATVPGKSMVYFPIALFAAIIFHIVITIYVTKKDKSKHNPNEPSFLTLFLVCSCAFPAVLLCLSCLVISALDPTRALCGCTEGDETLSLQ